MGSYQIHYFFNGNFLTTKRNCMMPHAGDSLFHNGNFYTVNHITYDLSNADITVRLIKR